MENIKTIVGENLKNIRKHRALTLQELSEITDVSKSMLGEIERSVTNPTITVLWKIASGLKIPITQLLDEEKPDVVLVRNDEQNRINPKDPFSVSTIYDYDPKKQFEVFSTIYPPKTKGDLKTHNQDMEECFLLYEGEIIVELDNETYILKAGDSIRFLGSKSHRYLNEGNIPAKAHSIIYYGVSDTK